MKGLTKIVTSSFSSNSTKKTKWMQFLLILLYLQIYYLSMHKQLMAQIVLKSEMQ